MADTTTNNRGKMMEEFIASNQLYIINEDSPSRTLQSTRVESNLDLTIVNNHMLADVTRWENAEVESASDHNILKFSISLEAG
jgi:endonuclease/exonuclease/phosphatase family metal-dependent hydrolase